MQSLTTSTCMHDVHLALKAPTGHNLTKKELKKLKKRMMKMQKQQGGGGNHGGHAHAQQQQGQPHEQFYNVYGANVSCLMHATRCACM